MEIPERFHITETGGWLVSHRMNSALPGYLMVCSKADINDLPELSGGTLGELGPLLAAAQKSLKQELHAERVYIGRYGHSPGYPIHFHVIPIYSWVEALFWKDERYRLLKTFAEGPGETPTDGAELTFFVWREFCERAEPDTEFNCSKSVCVGIHELPPWWSKFSSASPPGSAFSANQHL